MSWLGTRRERNILGFDTESTGLHPYLPGEKLRLIQIGDERSGWAIPWEQWGGVALEAIAKWEGDWAVHNCPHDQQWMAKHAGVELPWNRIQETMVQVALLDPLKAKGKIKGDSGGKGLKEISEELHGKAALAGEAQLKKGMQEHGWTWATVPFHYMSYIMYSALDPVLATYIDKEYRPWVLQNASAAYDLERGAQRVCTRMMQRGMMLDVPYVYEARGKLEEYSTKARDWLKSSHGVTSPNSGGQLRRALEREGQEILFFTKQGAPQFDKNALTFYKVEGQTESVRQIADCVLKIRHAEKIIGSYLDNFLKYRDADDIIHASINTLAARTGRMSVTNPALQTLHRNDVIVRGSLIPRPGHAFITCDLNQVEARMAAHFTEDAGLISSFLRAEEDGSDFFCELGELIFGEPISKKDPRRNMVKTIVYRTNYGGGENIEAMAMTAEVPIEQMAHAKAGFDASFPGVEAELKRTELLAKSRTPPHLFSPYGRRFLLDPGQEYTQGFNARIQGHAAEYFKRCLLDMDAAGLGDQMVMVVHDECILEVAEGDAEEVLRIVEECMTDKENYRVPITAEGQILRERWKK